MIFFGMIAPGNHGYAYSLRAHRLALQWVSECGRQNASPGGKLSAKLTDEECGRKGFVICSVSGFL